MLDHTNKISTGSTKVIPPQKNREPCLGTSMRFVILSLLISLFIRLLDAYLLIMVEITKTGALKAVLSTRMYLWV